MSADLPVTSRRRAEQRVQSLAARISRFLTLDEDERRVLAALALFPVDVTRTDLANTCRHMRMLLGGKTPDTSKIGRLAVKCREIELLSWDGSHLSLEPDLGLFLVRLVAETPFGDRLRSFELDRAMSVLPPCDETAYRIYQSRLLRWTKRPGDAGNLLAQGLREAHREPDLAAWFGPGDPVFALSHVPDWNQWLPRATRTKLRSFADPFWELEVFSSLSNANGRPDVELFLEIDHRAIPMLRAQFGARYMSGDTLLVDCLQLWRMLTGDLESMRLHASSEVSQGRLTAKAYLAAAALAEGKLDESLELYSDAITASNVKGLAAFHANWLGVLHLIALLARRNAESLATARFVIQRLIGKGTKRDSSESPMALLALAEYYVHVVGSPLGQLRNESSTRPDIFEILSMLLSAIWMDQPEASESSWLEFAANSRERAAERGYRWLAGELAGICARLGAKSKRSLDSRTTTQWRPLVDLIQPQAPWEQALESLEHVAATGSKSIRPSDAPKPAARIAWFVQLWGDRLQAEPRLQTQKGSGFTRGRAIALQHFVAPIPTDLPISAADAEVSKHIRQDRSYYGATSYYLDESVCLGLVGHPHVFDAADESIQYDVKRGTVALRCEHLQTGGFALRLEPSIASVFKVQGDTTKAFVQRKGGEIWVYEITTDLKRVALLVGQELKIPKDGEARLRELLPRLSALVPTTASLVASEDAEVTAGDTLPVLRIRPKGETLRLQLLTTPLGPDGPGQIPGIGTEITSLFVEGRAQHVRRSLDVERSRAAAVWQKLSVLGGITDDYLWVAPDLPTCLTLLAELATLDDADARIEWPEGQPLRLKRIKRLTVDIKGGSAAQWFDADGTIELEDGAELRIFELLAKLERRLGRFVALSTGDFAELSQSALERLTLLQSFSEKSNAEGALRVAPWMALALPQLADPICVESGSEGWKDWRKRTEGALTRDFVPTKHFTGTLREYQLEGFRWLCRMASLGTGVCLADDMGLGKTIQTLAMLQHRATRKIAPGETTGPILIVAPASVCPGWVSEANRFTPNLEPRWLSGKERSLEKLTRKTLLVCTYDVLHRDIETLKQTVFDTVVLDEAQQIKNAHTRRARAAFSLNAGFRLATTGTPIENHLGELWSLFHFLMPGLLGDQHQFVERFRSPIENAKDTSRKQQLRALVQPFLLRRTKQQVLSELPEKTEIVRQVQLSPAEVEIYEAIRLRGLDALSKQAKDKNQHRVRVLAELMRLRRACCHPRLVLPDSEVPSSKLQMLLELVTELRDAGHRALVFSQFVDHLALVREALDDLGIAYQYLDGSTRPTERAKSVDAFQAGEGDLFLISLRAGGTGLNLTAADYVIHLDPWWNPAVEDQASDRAHRIGQERPVTIYRLVTAGTIEQKLVNMHAEKRTLAADILADTDTTKRLDPEELMNLLREAALGSDVELGKPAHGTISVTGPRPNRQQRRHTRAIE